MDLTFHSQQGNLIYVRPLGKDDLGNLLDLFEHMGTESRYHRFFQSLEHVNPIRVQKEAKHIIEMHPERGVALIAFADLPDQLNTPIAVTRYIVLDTETAEAATAEFAISVRDDQQGIGIGMRLTQLIFDTAASHGVHTMVASVHGDNYPMCQILRQLDYPHTSTVSAGIIEFQFDMR